MRFSLNVRQLALVGLLVAAVIAMPAVSRAQVAVGVGVRITVAPPALPVYEQPPCPTEGFLWTPGYWGYGPSIGYYWIPGAWVAPPHPGLLWTPGYWGFVGGVYGWHEGYWGPHVGFYGGINYGFGYTGVGFWGGRWAGGVFQYNTAAWHVGAGFHGVYEDRTFINNTTVVNHYSFNGDGGVHATPTADERAAMNEQHYGRTPDQVSARQSARVDRSNYASVNHGTPAHPEGMGVNARQDRQQNRINQGVHSGQLTPGETSHIEKNETGIHNEARSDRQANGGHLTPEEHSQIEHQQNQESRQIARDKHNNKTDAHPQGGDKGGNKDGGKH